MKYVGVSISLFLQSQELMQKNQTAWAIHTAGQSGWVSWLRALFLTFYTPVPQWRLRYNQWSKETSRKWFHMDRKWMDKQRLFWATINTLHLDGLGKLSSLGKGSQQPAATSATEVPKLLSNWMPAKGKHGHAYQDVLTAFCFQLLNSSKKHLT